MSKTLTRRDLRAYERNSGRFWSCTSRSGIVYAELAAADENLCKVIGRYPECMDYGGNEGVPLPRPVSAALTKSIGEFGTARDDFAQRENNERGLVYACRLFGPVVVSDIAYQS